MAFPSLFQPKIDRNFDLKTSAELIPSVKDGWMRLECSLLTLSVVLLAMAFPLQVLARSPLPALLPYAVLLVAWLVRVRYGFLQERHSRVLRMPCALTGLDWGVMTYACLVLGHMVFNLWEGTARWSEIGANVFNFLFPLCFYLYFRFSPRRETVRAILFGVLVASLLSSTYSVSHAYLKLRHTPVPGSPAADAPDDSEVQRNQGWTIFSAMHDYQLAAAEYSRVRAGETEDFVKKTMRYGGSRSAGLQESNSVSAAWIALGLFSVWGVVPRRKAKLRAFFLLLFAVMLLIFQYYTAIFAAAVVFLIMKFGIHSSCEERKPHSSRWPVIGFFVLIFLIFLIELRGADEHYLINLRYMAQLQFRLLFGGGEVHYIQLIAAKINGFVDYLRNFPWVILFGDGLGIYYPYSFSKGGDVGFVETLARIGVPMSLLLLLSVIPWMVGFISQQKNIVFGDASEACEINTYALSVVLFVFINDIHYSIWPAKSIFPLIMAVLALWAATGDKRWRR